MIPDAGEKLLGWVEKEMNHRQSLEMKELTAHIEMAKEDRAIIRRGQDRAFVIAITFGLFSLIAILNGFTVGGSILGGGTLATLVIAFLATRGKPTPTQDESTAVDRANQNRDSIPER